MLEQSPQNMSAVLSLKLWRGDTQKIVGKYLFEQKQLYTTEQDFNDFCKRIIKYYDKERVKCAIQTHLSCMDITIYSDPIKGVPTKSDVTYDVGYIYLFENPDATFYIGKTVQRPEVRWTQHFTERLKLVNNDPIAEMLMRAGWKKVKKSILAELHNCTDVILSELEKHYIKHYSKIYPGKLLNKTRGLVNDESESCQRVHDTDGAGDGCSIDVQQVIV